MVELISKSPCDGLLPLKIGRVEATEADLGSLTAIMPYTGKDKALSETLKDAHGLAAPGPNRSTGKEGARAIWFGRGQLLLAGPEPDTSLAIHAALSDQSDAWACVELTGPDVEDVLARLVPVDMRSASFKRGQSVRTLIQHMNGSITRIGADRFLVLVFRSMAATLVHDLKEAMESVAAQN